MVRAFPQKYLKHALLLVLIWIECIFSGCSRDQKPPKVGVADWIPKSVGGPTEIRRLPPASEIDRDYKQWVESDSRVPKARLYEATIHETNQFNFSVTIGRGDTPLGATDTTFVEFIYRDSTNGEYQLVWHRRGRHKPDYLRPKESKKFLLQPFDTEDATRIPRLKIVGVEGVEVENVVVANSK